MLDFRGYRLKVQEMIGSEETLIEKVKRKGK